jgi:purine catabolism regulator
VSLTIEELTRIPYLRTWIHAGVSGASNVVTWAHSIEIPRPWEWLERGDLVMTVGLGIPAERDLQVEYVRQLAAIGASGVTIGADMQAPPLSAEMLEAADECAFPVCFTAYEVPFVQISRTVAAASQRADYARITGMARIYEQARIAAARNASASELLRGLEAEVDCDLYAIENERGALLVAGSSPPTQELQDELRSALSPRDINQPGLRRVRAGAAEVLIVPIPARRSVSLVANPRGDSVPAFAVLQQIATLAALELERLWATREELRRLGSELLAHLLDDRISPGVASARIAPHGLSQGPYRILAVRLGADHTRAEHLHHALGDQELPHLLLRRDELLYALVTDRDRAVDALESLLDRDVRIGVSSAFDDLDGTRAAVRQARWALESARLEKARLVTYGEQGAMFLPRSIAEASAIVRTVLGSLLDWDEHHNTELLDSLTVFLSCNRAWQRAAAELHVHKQTLVYRMRRVEELTGRKLSDTADVSELWLALQAQKLLG